MRDAVDHHVSAGPQPALSFDARAGRAFTLAKKNRPRILPPGVRRFEGRVIGPRYSGRPRYSPALPDELRNTAAWPEALRNFWASGDAERFVRSGSEGDRLDYFVRLPGEALIYSRPLAFPMNPLNEQYRNARELVNQEQSRNLRGGFISTWVLLASSVWLASLVLLALLAHHVSRPIQQLTAGLSELASGNFCRPAARPAG